MTAALGAEHITAVRDRVRRRLVGREHELDLVLAAVAAGRDIVLEGPPGTSKSTLLRGITAEWGIPLVFVEGNADLTPAKLVGHHNPARVLREDYSADNFVDGPLGGSDDIDLDRTIEQLVEHPIPEEDDIIVRERVRTRRSVVLLADVSGSMRGERVRTAAATVGALAAELARDDLAVIAFWSDAAVLSHLGQRSSPQQLLDTMLRIPAKGLTNIAFPLQVAARELARVPARDARVLLLSDCVHNAGPDPRPLAARLPRLDVLLDTSGEQDADLARDLARHGHGRLLLASTYRDIAPALATLFTDLPVPAGAPPGPRTQGGAMPVIVVATIRPLPEHRDEVRAALAAAIPQVHGEEGCELYALNQKDDRFVMIERWASRAALQTHSTDSAGLQKLNAELKGKLEAPLDVLVLEPVPAGEPAKGAL